MSTEQNKAIVRRFFEAFNANDQAALKDVLAADLVAYSHAAPGPHNREVHLQGISMWNAAFETQFTVEEQIAEGDKVATRVTMRAILRPNRQGKLQVGGYLYDERTKQSPNAPIPRILYRRRPDYFQGIACT